MPQKTDPIEARVREIMQRTGVLADWREHVPALAAEIRPLIRAMSDELESMIQRGKPVSNAALFTKLLAPWKGESGE